MMVDDQDIGPEYGVGMVDDDFKRSGIYQIVCLINGKRYVGSAIRLGKRWGEHLCTLTANRHRCRHLQSAWNKYGARNFAFEVLEYVADPERLIEREQFHITETNAADPNFGFNTRWIPSSNFGVVFSEEVRQKFSEARIGKPHSEETKQKIREALIGKKISEETRRKFSETRIGRTLSDETRRKMSEAHTGKTLSEEHKRKVGEARSRRTHSEESKQKIREARLGKTGTPCSEERKKKISEAMTGKTQSEETKQKRLETWARKKALRMQSLDVLN